MLKYKSKFSFEIKNVMLKIIISAHGAGKLLVNYNFEVIKYFLYIYIFLDEKYKFVYNVISLKTIYTYNLDIKKILFLWKHNLKKNNNRNIFIYLSIFLDDYIK